MAGRRNMLGVTWARLAMAPCSMSENAQTPVASRTGKLTIAESME
jgi:hypothetical protein